MLRVLVIGGEGSLGRQITARVLRAGYDGVAIPGEDLDVLDRTASRRAIRRMRPEVVVDCGLSETEDGDMARGASNAARAARECGASSLYLSSVEVFDGEAGMPYLESDKPRPVTALGSAQLAAEGAVAYSNHRHAIIRSGALFGYGPGDLASEVLAQAGDRDRMAVDSTTRISPIYSGHLAEAAVSLLQRASYGVFHVPDGGSCTKLQFARAVLRMTGSRTQAVAAEPGSGPPLRRTMTLASCRGVGAPPDWRMALHAYIQTLRPGAEEPAGIHT